MKEELNKDMESIKKKSNKNPGIKIEVCDILDP
jgi:hypothetical protein